MTLKEYKNRTGSVNDRLEELCDLLLKLKRGEEVDFDRIIDLVKQSHKKEIELISLIADREDNSDVDVPEFMK